MDEQRPRAEAIAALRTRIAQIEGIVHSLAEAAPDVVWPVGVAGIDAALGGGLRRDALHVFRPGTIGDVVAAEGLLLALAAGQPTGELLWVTTAAQAREWGRPYAPGLARFGLGADRLLVVEARRPAEAAWAIEEGLKSRAFTAVLATGQALDFATSRRLALAAADYHCPCLAVDAPGQAVPLVATTLWAVAVRPAEPDPFDAQLPRGAAWRVELLKVRGRHPAGPWELAWDEAAHHLALAAAPADRPAPPVVPAWRGAADTVRAERGRTAWA